MEKINRNDPCPCGSGEKYKKCCGNNVVEFPTMVVFEEAISIQMDFMEYALTLQSPDLANLIMEYSIFDIFEEMEENDDFQDVHTLYMSYLLKWAIFTQPLMKGKTVFEDYLQKKGRNIQRSRTRTIVESWKYADPGLYMVKESTDKQIVIEDVLSHQLFNLPPLNKDETPLDAGSLMLGTLLNMGQFHFFFAGESLNIPVTYAEASLEAFQQDLEEYLEHGGPEESYMRDQFPDLLEAFFLEIGDGFGFFDPEHFEWNNKKEQQAAVLLIENMEKEGYPQDLIKGAVLVWFEYCIHNMPTIRKPEAYAAGVEYFITTIGLDHFGPSQKKVAEKYGISPSTLGKRFKEISDSVMEEFEDD
jgi:uncharacterized protein